MPPSIGNKEGCGANKDGVARIQLRLQQTHQRLDQANRRLHLFQFRLADLSIRDERLVARYLQQQERLKRQQANELARRPL